MCVCVCFAGHTRCPVREDPDWTCTLRVEKQTICVHRSGFKSLLKNHIFQKYTESCHKTRNVVLPRFSWCRMQICIFIQIHYSLRGKSVIRTSENACSAFPHRTPCICYNIFKHFVFAFVQSIFDVIFIRICLIIHTQVTLYLVSFEYSLFCFSLSP